MLKYEDPEYEAENEHELVAYFQMNKYCCTAILNLFQIYVTSIAPGKVWSSQCSFYFVVLHYIYGVIHRYNISIKTIFIFGGMCNPIKIPISRNQLGLQSTFLIMCQENKLESSVPLYYLAHIVFMINPKRDCC